MKDSTNPAVKSAAADMANPSAPQPSLAACGLPAPRFKLPPKFGTLLRVAQARRAGKGTAYFLRVPVTYRPDRPAPLLVYLSGGAGLALDGVNTADDAIANTDYLVLYPQAADYWWKPEAAKRVDAALRDTLNEFNVDRDRVYLAGFSNGGTGALYMAALWPQRFAAVVSLMGAGQCNQEVQKGTAQPAESPPAVRARRKGFAHSVVLFQRHVRLDRRNASLGLRPSCGCFPDREHDITLDSDDGLSLAFLKDKVRDAFPSRVSLRLPDLAYPRQYWVEVLEKRSGVAEVKAEIKPPNRLEIHSREVKKLRLHLRPEMFFRPGPVQILWNGKQMYKGPVRDPCAAAAGPSVDDPKLDLSDRKEFSLP